MRMALGLILLALGSASAALPAASVVSMINYRYVDATTTTPITLAATDSVVGWIATAGTHTATALDGSFDVGPLAPGASGTWQPAQPGVYSYACRFHVNMQGIVIVA